MSAWLRLPLVLLLVSACSTPTTFESVVTRALAADGQLCTAPLLMPDTSGRRDARWEFENELAERGILSKTSRDAMHATFRPGPRAADALVDLRAWTPTRPGLVKVCFGSIAVIGNITRTHISGSFYRFDFRYALALKPWARDYLRTHGMNVDGYGHGLLMETNAHDPNAAEVSASIDPLLRRQLTFPVSGTNWYPGILPCVLRAKGCGTIHV